jgi:plasmid maintenance system antidote protein VapI
MEKLHNPTAGEILRDKFLVDMTVSYLAKNLNLTEAHIIDFINGDPINAYLDEKLCNFFGLSKGYFLRLQEAHDKLN